MKTVEVPIPEDFDFVAAFEKALQSILASVVRLEMLKRKPYLTGKEVEELYTIPESSLRTWRTRGGGPKFFQPYENGPVRYEHNDIKDFMQKNHIRD
jgi:hypothetical protein